MARTKILLDCDPGHDDAAAILYAARHLDLVGITTCHGNNTIEHVTRNALSVLRLGGIAIPLAQGAGAPLIGGPPRAAEAHGATGLDGAALPAPTRTPIATHAVDFLIEQASAHRGELVLAVLGPATNVALAIKREPRFAAWLREISVMGGSAGRGNILPTVEYNVACDPEAAAILFACGAPIRMVGYDVTSRTGATEADIARLCAGGQVARTIADLLSFYRARQLPRAPGRIFWPQYRAAARCLRHHPLCGRHPDQLPPLPCRRGTGRAADPRHDSLRFPHPHPGRAGAARRRRAKRACGHRGRCAPTDQRGGGNPAGI